MRGYPKTLAATYACNIGGAYAVCLSRLPHHHCALVRNKKPFLPLQLAALQHAPRPEFAKPIPNVQIILCREQDKNVFHGDSLGMLLKQGQQTAIERDEQTPESLNRARHTCLVQ